MGDLEMIKALSRWRDQFLGRGEAAITIPIFDGALKPNRVLEDAKIFVSLPDAEDLATDGSSLFVADGKTIRAFIPGEADRPGGTVRAEFDKTVTAIATMSDGGLIVALEGRQILIVGGAADGRSWSAADGKPFVAANAIAVRQNGNILVSDGSNVSPYDRWCHDLMTGGKTARVVELDPRDGTARVLASHLAYAFGVCEADGAAWACESWRHRIVRLDAKGGAATVLDGLPAYPSRIAAAADGGFWLTAFAGRTQLVEFVLREPKFRDRMIAEVDPRYWIAPALNSGKSFLEPLQGAGLKMRGIMKPWAPPRSYGLVIKLSAAGAIEHSFHSRLDGVNHGVVAVAECQGSLFVLSKGSGRLLQLATSENQLRVVQ
jgi:sugar lactone lactonase YvrE